MASLKKEKHGGKMYIVNAVVVLIILLAISTMLDPVFTSSINNAGGL